MEKVVTALLKQGMDKNKAYAIAQSQEKKLKAKKKTKKTTK